MDQPLDAEATARAFEALTEEVNAYYTVFPLPTTTLLLEPH
jgi:hypothetical protein